MNCAVCSDIKGGALPCNKVLKGQRSHRCPDDQIMTTRLYWKALPYGGGGRCVSLTSAATLSGFAVGTWAFPVIGKGSLVLTKAFVSHPNKAGRPVGIVMFKRIVSHTCTGKNPAFCKEGTTVADVHKVGYCIRCHYNVFPSIRAHDAKDHDRTAFVQKCLPKAIDANGNIRPRFRCTGNDMKRAKASVSGF